MSSLTLSLFAPAPPPPSGGSFDLSYQILTDADVSAVQSLVAPTVVFIRAIAAGSAHPLRTEFPSRDITVFDGTEPALAYDEAFHRVEYYWTITRPAGAGTTFDPPGPYGYNMPVAWNNRNKAYGPMIAVCLDRPGVHTIECFAVDREGNSASHSVTLTAIDPNVAYAGPLTVACRPVGDTDNSWIPAGATIITTGTTDFERFQAAATAMLTSTGLSPALGRRLLLKPGHTYDATNFVEGVAGGGSGRLVSFPNTGTAVRRWYIGTPLNTAQATVLTGSRQLADASSRDCRIASVTINNVNAKGAWDVIAETVVPGATSVALCAWGEEANFHTHWQFHKCKVEGYYRSISTPSSNVFMWPGAVRNRVLFSECFLAGFGDYGWFLNVGWAHGSNPFPATAAFIGTKWFRPPEAPQGTSGTTTYPQGSNNRYPLTRGAGYEWLYMGGCDIGHWTWQNPMWRWGDNTVESNGIRPPYPRVVLDRCVVEGFVSWATGASANGSPYPGGWVPRVPQNAVLDRVLVIAPSNVESGFSFNTGTTLRNSVFVVPPVAAVVRRNGVDNTAPVVRQMFRFNNAGEPAGLEGRNNFWHAQPSEVYNNTFVMLRTELQNRANTNSGETQLFSIGDKVTVTQWNNVYHAPEFGTDAGPFVSDLIPGVTPRALGHIGTFTAATLSFAAPGIAPGETFTLPYSQIPNTTVFLQPLKAAVSRQYWIDNPTHNQHQVWRSGDEFNSIIRAGLESNRTIRVLEYNDTGIVFQNNRTTAMTGTWFFQIDRRNLRPDPVPAEATPPLQALSWEPTGANPAVAGATAPATTREFFGDVQSPRNRGAF